jgi:formylglycine-generating enzyme required for sulfatase activity
LTEPLPTTEDEEPARQPWRHGTLLPLRVELREFAARGLSAPGADATAKHLCDFVAAELAAAALGDYAPYLWETLREEGGLLLLDGLDEVPAARKRRAQIKGVVEDFAKAFPACRILVTSRTYAYQRQAWRLDGFAETVLAPFGEGQIARFVERWYAHIGALRGLHAEESAGRAELLRRAISNSERLRGLAERPLLLTLMASLHAWRSGSLPEKREELYADTVDLLLDWWERPKVVRDEEQVIVQQPSLAEWLKVDRDKVRGLLNTLAYAAHAEQAELVGTADVPEGALLSGLLRLSQNPDVNPARLVEYLSQRAGLLLPRGVGVYTFPHRTFQEYLAACHLVVDTYPDKVARLGREEPGRWREVVLLAGAATTARGSDFALWALVEELCPPDALPETQTEADAWGALLAGQALVESADVGQVSARNEPKVKRVQGHLVRILERAALPAVERVAAGDVLAKLGDPRPGVGLREDGLPDLVWCEVPAGVFTMGSENDSLSFLGKETPQRQVEVPRFWISQYPITNAQYEVFVQAGGYRNPAYWTEGAKSQVWTDGKVKAWNDDVARDKPYDYGAPFNLLNHPVVGVTWYEAVAFCRWLTEQVTGGEAWRLDGDGVEAMTIALPSETQWEKAARGPDGRIYPWGDAADPERANYDDTGIGTTSAVGCFPRGASPYGVLDMSGNAWEWCATKFQGSYEDYQDDNDVEGTDARVLRGGAFHYTDRSVRCAYRYYGSPYNRYGGNGFRVVASPSAPVFSERPAPAVSERPALHSG